VIIHIRYVSRLQQRTYSQPCGGGIECLHRDPVSRRRRRKGKSQIWDRKIWSQVEMDSDPRKTTLARASSIYKWQTRRLVRDGAPRKQDRNCQRVINISSWAPERLDTKTYWLTERQSQCDSEFSPVYDSSRRVHHKQFARVQFSPRDPDKTLVCVL
jgi:hypothetical protein